MDNMYDKYGCCNSCGYTWCEILNECIRVWETECSNHRILTKLDNFSIDQLMLFIGGVLGSLGALLLVIQKSKCKSVECCCIKCIRDTDLILKEEKLEKGLPTTPKPKEPNLELVKEPEVEEP